MNWFDKRWEWRVKARVKIRQNEAEIRAACDLVAGIQPKVLLEVGAFQGGSLWMLAGACEFQAHLIVVDLCDRRCELTLTRVFDELKAEGFRVDLIRGDSRDAKTVAKTRDILGDNNVDVLHVDADHRYAAVMDDYRNYWPLVRMEGMAMFHDVLHPKLGAFKAWKEISQEHPSHVIHYEQEGDNPLADHATAIGLIWKIVDSNEIC